MEIRPPRAFRTYLRLFTVAWAAVMVAAAIGLPLATGSLAAIVGPIALLIFGVLLLRRWARTCVIGDATGLSVVNLMGFERIPKSEIEDFRMRFPSVPNMTALSAALGDGSTYSLDATWRINPLPGGKRRVEEQLGQLRDWLRAESTAG